MAEDFASEFRKLSLKAKAVERRVQIFSSDSVSIADKDSFIGELIKIRDLFLDFQGETDELQ